MSIRLSVERLALFGTSNVEIGLRRSSFGGIDGAYLLPLIGNDKSKL